MTSIHPESYETTKEILRQANLGEDAIGKPSTKLWIELMDRRELKEKVNVDSYTFNDILDAIVQPLRDPRDEFDAPQLRGDILKLEDLEIGMELEGTVRNVVDFGAFVDCGLEQDGLVTSLR